MFGFCYFVATLLQYSLCSVLFFFCLVLFLRHFIFPFCSYSVCVSVSVWVLFMVFPFGQMLMGNPFVNANAFWCLIRQCTNFGCMSKATPALWSIRHALIFRRLSPHRICHLAHNNTHTHAASILCIYVLNSKRCLKSYWFLYGSRLGEKYPCKHTHAPRHIRRTVGRCVLVYV